MADPAIQRAALKGVLSLPKPVLRLLSGGGVVYRGGRTLDPAAAVPRPAGARARQAVAR